MSEHDDLRDYGLPDTDPVGVPKATPVTEIAGAECPNCRCKEIMEVKVGVVNVPLLKGGIGVSTYLGCPACPWASPAVVAACPPKGRR